MGTPFLSSFSTFYDTAHLLQQTWSKATMKLFHLFYPEIQKIASKGKERNNNLDDGMPARSTWYLPGPTNTI